jgi:hypothetical protein
MVDLGTAWMASLLNQKVLELILRSCKLHVSYPLCKSKMRFVACDVPKKIRLRLMDLLSLRT